MLARTDARPRPWHWDDNAAGFEGSLMILSADGAPVACLGDMEETDGVDLANADLIVEAVNGYENLKKAARAVVEMWDVTRMYVNPTAVPLQLVVNELRTSIDTPAAHEEA